MSRVPVRRALVSVWEKTGLVEFATRLVEAGVEILSSGGTAGALSDAGLAVTPVEDVTGAPEMLGGRVKTLHPSIHGGILADTSVDEHVEDLAARGIEQIDLVVVNLYPFEMTVADPAVADAEAIEKIDIGGPTMVRAAAKNHGRVGVVIDPDQYDEVAAAVEAGGLDDGLRSRLARAAFFRTAAYDAAIVAWFERGNILPDRVVLPLEKQRELRYGENPHQQGAAYAPPSSGGWWTSARQLQGKQMSFNNYLDTEAAWRMVQEFDEPAIAIVKHANPCGLAVAAALADAFTSAWECDPLSAFGSVIAANRELDEDTAARIVAAGFVEVVIAGSVADEAAGVLADKKNLRLLIAEAPAPADPDYRRIDGGFVRQQRDTPAGDGAQRSVVSTRPPTADESAALEFAWKVVAHTKSNAIVIARDGAAVGVGAGDQSRVGAAERALAKAGDRARGAVAASDAFLPFRDGLDVLAQKGITAIIEPGGSVRDDEVIAAADEQGLALVFTGRRHFRH
jgi:phosphoribosylaminoimidazolecarboxamide formyltransferase/IMP cyclohydrolase